MFYPLMHFLSAGRVEMAKYMSSPLIFLFFSLPRPSCFFFSRSVRLSSLSCTFSSSFFSCSFFPNLSQSSEFLPLSSPSPLSLPVSLALQSSGPPSGRFDKSRAAHLPRRLPASRVENKFVAVAGRRCRHSLAVHAPQCAQTHQLSIYHRAGRLLFAFFSVT